jgi:hypothetical protein
LFENFLIWAGPGSGKTHFVGQINEHLRNTLSGDLDYVYCNLAEDSPTLFKEKVSSLPIRTCPVLCFLDEIDARPDEMWPYDVCFPHLSINRVEEMARAMSNRHKGKDLLSRVFGPNRFTIPTATPLDSAIIFLGEVFDALGERVKTVEKLALLYALCEPTLRNSPRQLTEFVRRAVGRIPDGESRLRYNHAFDPGDLAELQFWADNRQLLTNLQNVDVKVFR